MIKFIFCFIILFATTVISQSFCINGSSGKVNSCFNKPESFSDWDDFTGSVQALKIEQSVFQSEKPLLLQTSLFNQKGQKTEQIQYRDDGVAQPKTIYIFDKNGSLIKQHQYSAVSGKPFLEDTYNYNSDNSLKEIVRYNLDDNRISYRKEFTYNKESNFTTVREFDTDNNPRSFISFVRDKQCRVIEASFENSYQFPPGRIVITYNDKGNETQFSIRSEKGLIEKKSKNEYEFDERGNWIKGTYWEWETENNKSFYKLRNTIIRTITYYP